MRQNLRATHLHEIARVCCHVWNQEKGSLEAHWLHGQCPDCLQKVHAAQLRSQSSCTVISAVDSSMRSIAVVVCRSTCVPAVHFPCLIRYNSREGKVGLCAGREQEAHRRHNAGGRPQAEAGHFSFSISQRQIRDHRFWGLRGGAQAASNN